MTSLEEIAKKVEEHYEQNPTHGPGCTCLDTLIRDLREELAPFSMSLKERVHLDSQQRKIYSSKRYILHIASKERDI